MKQKQLLSWCSSFIIAMFAFLLPSPVLAQDAATFSLNASVKNAATVTQETDGSWTIVTTGDNPYVATSRLMRDLTEAETSLTFEYKASEDALLEIYFSTSAVDKFDAAYCYSLGKAPQAGEWTRVTIDVTKARKQWGWGKAGQNIRIDAGTAEGLTFNIRDIRFSSDAMADPLKDYTITDGAIQINSQADFDKWIAGYNTFITSCYIADANVTLNADVTAASTTGCIIPRYNAVFDGNGHTLDVNMEYTTSSANISNGNSFFSELYGTVKNLTVTGTVKGNTKFLASVARAMWDGAVLENITSYVDIISEIEGDGTHGGLIGACYGTSTLKNVVFAGSMSGSSTSMCGGLVGWLNTTTVFESCLMIANLTVDATNGNTIARNPGHMKGTRVFANKAMGDTPASCTIVDAAKLESGEVCFKLNGDQKEIAWYQTIGEDPVPVLDKTHKQVYSPVEMDCAGNYTTENPTFSNEVCESHVADHNFVCGVCTVCGLVQPNYIQQDADGYFIVDTPDKLVYIANYASAKPSTNIRITADLDMTEVSEYYQPISGTYSGIFDGGGHTISNFVLSMPETNYVALVGVAGNCTIKNLTLDATCHVEGKNYVGGFVGSTNGGVTIYLEGLVMHGNVVAHGINAAGIWGCNMGNSARAYIKNCGVSGFIKGDDQTAAFSGYAGVEKTTVENCWFSAAEIEGIYGNNPAEVFIRPAGTIYFKNCYSTLGMREGVTEITEEVATTGELTYRLNGNQSNIAWYQTIGEDAFPTLNNTHKQVFFSGQTACDGELLTDGAFSNDGENNIDDHEYTDGVCDNCGEEEPGFMTIEQDEFGWFIIDTPEKFAYIANKASKEPTINIRITEDLDLGAISANYQPITGAYAGTIDGGGHVISNFIIDRPEEQMMALIGKAGACTIKNLTMDATCNITGAGYSAGFVGQTTGSGTITFENVFMHGDVTCNGANGAAIYACNMGSSMTVVMKNCGVTGNVYGGREAGSMSGWLGGKVATLTNCWSVGTVEAPRNDATYFAPPNGVNLVNCYSAYGSNSSIGKIGEDAAESGELTWKLNGSTFINPTWYQNLNEGDPYPTMDPSRGTVYKGAEGYATINQNDPESVEAIIKAMADAGKAYIELDDVQTYANIALLEEYTALVEAYEDITEWNAFVDNYNAEQAKYQEVKTSVAAYKNYEAAMIAIKTELEGRSDFSGPDREFLEGVYLGEDEVAPGTHEAAPNGNFVYIMENRVLTAEELAAETALANELLRIAVANGYEAGTDITNLLANANFADGFNGWKGTVFTGTGASNVEGSTMRAAEGFGTKNFDMYQEIVVAKGGVYELQVRGGTRVSNDWNSTQLSPYIYLNDNANYLQAVKEGAISVEEAEDGVNAHLTGSIADLPIYNEEGDTIAWVPQGPLGASIAFDAGRYDNRLVINVNAGDTLRVGIKQSHFGGGANDWSCIGDIHLIYQGALEDSEEAINRTVESMTARANTLLNTEFRNDGDYVKYPNWSQALKDQLTAAVEKAQSGDAAAKYAAIVEMGNIFKQVLDSKKAYRNYFAKTLDLEDVFYKGMEIDEAFASEWQTKFEEVYNKALAAYDEGSLSTKEAQDLVYISEIPVYPTIDENGTYHIANTVQMFGFVKAANANGALNAVLEGDVSVDTDMIITTDYSGVFDGQDHVMTLDINREEAKAAPFMYVRNGTIKNLVVDGTITSSNKFAGGVAAYINGAKLDRIESRVNIVATIDGDGTHGGIVGVNEGSGSTINNSVFSGSITGTAYWCAGVVGWSGAALNINNCIVIADITTGLHEMTHSDVIARNNRTASNCYYVTPYGGAPAGSTQVTPEQMESGYVTYALNGGKTRKDVIWRQNLGEDMVPSLNTASKVVYMKADSTYTNEAQFEIENYSGTEDDPFIIKTAGDMAMLRSMLVSGSVNYVKLGADIDMSGIEDWKALNLYDMQYNGSGYMLQIDFDGQGHTISNFTCTDPAGSYNSFFGIFCGNVRNVGFKDANVVASDTESGILGAWAGQSAYKNDDATKATSRVENVWITGKIADGKGGNAVGGFFGNIGGPTVMYNCYSNVEVTSNAALVGGIAGRVRDELTMNQVYAAGSVNGEGENVGGIIGGGQQASTSPSYYNNVVVWNNTDKNFGSTIAAQDVTLPTANLLDVVFNEENIAVDQSPMKQAIEVVGEPKVAYSDKWGKNVLYTEANGTTPVSYLKVPYAENQALKDAMSDGFTAEVTFAIQNDVYPGDVTPFRATESGGYGFDVVSNGQIKFVARTQIESENQYRYAATAAYAKVKTYYHMVGVYNKEDKKVYCYVNGGNAAEGAAAGALVFPTAPENQWLGIGADCGNTNGANFEIVSARMYDEPVSAEVAKALYYKQNGKDFYAGDKLSNISYYDGTNFAALQQIVVDWGKPWTCDMQEGSYPVFDGSQTDGISSVTNNAKGKIFNINGIQVEKTTKGLYIIDGKKVMVK